MRGVRAADILGVDQHAVLPEQVLRRQRVAPADLQRRRRSGRRVRRRRPAARSPASCRGPACRRTETAAECRYRRTRPAAGRARSGLILRLRQQEVQHRRHARDRIEQTHRDAAAERVRHDHVVGVVRDRELADADHQPAPGRVRLAARAVAVAAACIMSDPAGRSPAPPRSGRARSPFRLSECEMNR